MLMANLGASVAIVDMNLDGTNDIVRTDHAMGQSSIAYNNPANEGNFFDYELVYLQASEQTSIADLNNDDLPDIVVSDHGADRYLLNIGNGGDGFTNFTTFVFGTTPPFSDDGFAGESVAVDLDNNGFRDVLITDFDDDLPGCNRRMHIYRSLADPPNVSLLEERTATHVCNIPTGQLTGTHDVAVFDIDGDGWNDLVIGRCVGNRVWMNVTPYTACSCLADVNADGARDGLDITAFVACYLFGGAGCACADLNQDAAVGSADVSPFVSAILTGAVCP